MSLLGVARIVSTDDQKAVESLRLRHLVNEGTFTALTESVVWSESDENSKVFGIYSNDGQMISSMRVEVHHHAKELVPKLDYDELHKFVSFPCGLLGKAVTEKSYQGKGFNSYLRYLAYQYLFRLKIKYVAGTIMPNATRKNLLKVLGYEFIENPLGWRRYGYQSFGPTLVCYLDLQNNYERMLNILESKVKSLRSAYPFIEIQQNNNELGA